MFWSKLFKISLRNVNEIWEKWPKLNLILAPKSVKLKENDLSQIFHDESWFFYFCHWFIAEKLKNSCLIKSNKKKHFSHNYLVKRNFEIWYFIKSN